MVVHSALGLVPSPVDGNVAKKPAGWRLVNFTTSTVRPRPEPGHLKQLDTPRSGWSAVQSDFERRLSRFGIKVSETSDKSAASIPGEPVPFVPSPCHTQVIIGLHRQQTTDRSVANHEIMTTDLTPRKSPTIAPSANNRKDARFEVAEQQLGQAQTEARVWKDKFDAQQHNLLASYRETMEWRLRYEDLYSTVIQGQELGSQELPEKTGGQRSLG